MNIIFKITKAELRNLFYSPVAWFLGIIFMIICAVYYTDVLYTLTKSQELALKMPKFKYFEDSLTAGLYLTSNGIFSNVMTNLFLFIPLLTMGILSREVSSGSIKLLYSSPIKTRHIVFGKYLSLMFFNLLLISIIGVFILTGVFNIKSIDIGLLLSALLGFYLLVCAYASIGMFMSSLTTYQIISAIGTFLIIFVLGRIGKMWQDIDFVRDLTYFLSISGRANKMLNGLITSKDILYFILVISMFIGLTLLKLKSGRESKPWYITGLKYIALVLVTVLVGYVSSRPKLIVYWDTTAEKVNTIHPKVQQVLKDLGDEELEVTLFTNLLGGNSHMGMPKNRNTYLASMWEQYVRFKPDIKFSYEYYYASDDSLLFKRFADKSLEAIAKDYAKAGDWDLAMFKSPDEIRKIVDLGDEKEMLVMQLKYKGKTTFLRTYVAPIWPEQKHVAAALSRLKDTQTPKILFTSGNLERDIRVRGKRGYSSGTIGKTNRNSLINNGFDVDTISIDHQDIPTDIEALVLADPKTELSLDKQQKIRDYIAKGGNMLILGEPGKEDILNPILVPLGVKLSKGILVQINRHQTPDMVFPYLTKTAANLAETKQLLWLKSGDVDDSLQMVTPSATAIEYIRENEAFSKNALTQTSPKKGEIWLKTSGKLVLDSVPPVFSPADGDIKNESFITSVALTRKINNKEQRIAVMGDADAFSNEWGGGGNLGDGVYSWLANNEYPIYGPVPPPRDNLMLIEPNTAKIFNKLFVWAIPTLLTLLGALILIRRKRK